MTNDELTARIQVVEAFAVAALLAAIKWHKPAFGADHVVTTMDAIKRFVQARIAGSPEQLSAAGLAEADRYLDDVLSQFSEAVSIAPPASGDAAS
jgi:hypothetical protein